MPFLLLVIPVISTFAGGLLALRFRRSLALLTALGAGLLLGAAFLDLLPEALGQGATIALAPAAALGVALLSFLCFFSLQQLLQAWASRWQQSSQTLRRVGGAMLIFHSFRDGMAIGLSYAASHQAGYIVAAGIATHDLADGINTLILTTGGKPAGRTDYVFLALDCVAPLLGGLCTAWWALSPLNSVMLLAIAGGFFIQLAATEFLPEAFRLPSPRVLLIPAVFCGAAVIYFANQLIAFAL